MYSEKSEKNKNTKMRKISRSIKFNIPKVDLAPSKKNVIILKGKEYIKTTPIQLRNMIGYEIANTFSKYMKILNDLIDEAKHESSSRELTKIVNSFSEELETINIQYEKYLNEFLLIGGDEDQTIFMNYKLMKVEDLDDSEYTYDIDEKKYIFKYNKRQIGVSEWENRFKEKIYKIIESGSNNIENLIKFYRINKNKKNIELDKNYYDIIFPKYVDESSSEEISSSEEVSSEEESESEEENKSKFILKKKKISVEDENNSLLMPSSLQEEESSSDVEDKNNYLLMTSSDEEVSSDNEEEVSSDEEEEVSSDEEEEVSSDEEEEEFNFPRKKLKKELDENLAQFRLG